jgi:hypothetical protein
MRAEAAGAREAGHVLPDLKVLDAFAYGLDDAGVFGTRHKGQGRLDLVFVLHDQQVGEIQAGRLDFNQDFAGLGLGRRQFFPGQGVYAGGIFTKPGLHERSPMG